MPWKAIPYSNNDIKEKLSEKFNVNGIPALFFIDNEGTLLSNDGRSLVLNDPNGDNFL